MKTKCVLFLAIIFTLTIKISIVCGQTSAIGHVTAEVIESVSATSNVVTNFEFITKAENALKQLQSTALSSQIIDLGKIILNSGKDIACNVLVKPASLSDSEGNSFTIEPSIGTNSFASTAQSDGSHTVQINGKANMANSQAPGNYQGSYSVVFAYN